MRVAKGLKAVVAPPGLPLYSAARNALQEVIDAGIYAPGQRLPSTKELSRQMSVSLVTAHRALQELVVAGALERSQGKGTFVHKSYPDRKCKRCECRVGLMFHPDASLADFYHSQILEGVRQAAHAQAVDLILLRFGEDIRRECNGYLFVNPRPDELHQLANDIGRKPPTLVVGAKSACPRCCSIDVDNIDLARAGVNHLADLGHRHIAYVGGTDQDSNSHDRWSGFISACAQSGVEPKARHILKSDSWRLSETERPALVRMLKAATRPTAVFAGGFHLALDVYSAASAAGLRIPQDLSLVGVDDPPSAVHLSPPMTALHQPLVQLGRSALIALSNRILDDASPMESRVLKGELIVRCSSAVAPAAKARGRAKATRN
jgi:DNA-binding LacI/PurR family transcriptional regulator